MSIGGWITLAVTVILIIDIKLFCTPRDRIYISMAEYERLKDENKKLHHDVMKLSRFFKRLDLSPDICDIMCQESVLWEYCDDWNRSRRRYRIEFEVENFRKEKAQ